MMLTTTDLYCPGCDVRAIGLPDDGARHEIELERGDRLARCKACGMLFNTGTTRAFGGKMRPLTETEYRELVRNGWCTSHSGGLGVFSFDTNYVDGHGIEQRAHGLACKSCRGLVQAG